MHKRRLKGIAVALLLLGFYAWLSHSGRYSSYLLPDLRTLLRTFTEMVEKGILLKHILISLQRVFGGFFCAFSLATVLALLSYRFPKGMEAFDWLIHFLRNVPPLSLIPLLIIWLGIGETPKMILIVLACFFPMYLNIEKGFKSCERKWLEVGEAFGLTRWMRFCRIVLPAAVPDILVGMRTGLGYAYRAIIGAEMIAAGSGLGYMINFARSLSQTDVVFIGILTIGILGSLCDLLFKHLVSSCLKGVSGHGWN